MLGRAKPDPLRARIPDASWLKSLMGIDHQKYWGAGYEYFLTATAPVFRIRRDCVDRLLSFTRRRRVVMPEISGQRGIFASQHFRHQDDLARMHREVRSYVVDRIQH